MHSRRDTESIAALVAIYQAERSDSTSNMNFSIGIVGAEAAYLVGTSALWDKFTLLKGWIAFLPCPLACLFAFQSLLLGASATKAVSITHLERHLKVVAKLSAKDPRTDTIGFVASERIFNVRSAARSGNRPFVGATVVTYGGITSVIAGYTGVIVVQTFSYLHRWNILIAVAYFFLLGLVTLSWRAGLRIVGDVNA